MAANVQITVPGALVGMLDTILAERSNGRHDRLAAREEYFLTAIRNAIEADAAKIDRPTLGRIVRRPS